MRETRRNPVYLRGVDLPPNLVCTSSFAEVAGAEAFVLAVPTLYLRATLGALRSAWPKNSFVVGVVKGVEQGTFARPSEIVRELVQPRAYVALAGPSHAEEIVQGKPTSVVAAADDLTDARLARDGMHGGSFRVYSRTNLRSTELAGALKNVVAIAAGVSDGLGFGDNAKSALVARGLKEMARFGVAEEVLNGLAGVGDLITTCFSPHGRNRKLGQLIGQGKSLDEALTLLAPNVAEGVGTAKAIFEQAAVPAERTPIVGAVYDVLFRGVPALEAVKQLMARVQRDEDGGDE
jgi:glycerol-3-phosphate dehydrogenase (NAD(P)+)